MFLFDQTWELALSIPLFLCNTDTPHVCLINSGTSVESWMMM